MGDESEYEGGANPRGRSGDLGSVYDIGAPLEAALAYHHGELSRRSRIFLASLLISNLSCFSTPQR